MPPRSDRPRQGRRCNHLTALGATRRPCHGLPGSAQTAWKPAHRTDLAHVQGYGGVRSSPVFGRPTGYLHGRTVRLSMQRNF